MNYLTIGATAILTALIAYGLHSFDVNRINANHAKELTRQNDALVAQCEHDKNITKRVSHDLQKNLSNLDRQLAAARLLHRCTALTVKTKPAAGHDGSTERAKPTGQGVGSTGRSIDINLYLALAGEGERYRSQLLACQRFVKLADKPAEAK